MTTVLSVDDSEDDNLLMKRACKKAPASFRLQVLDDGQKAIDYLSGAGAYGDREQYPMPDLMLLDLKMPRKNGLEVLDWIRQQAWLQSLPIAIFSSSEDHTDIRKAYEIGATWFMMKPVDLNDLLRLVATLNTWETERDPKRLQALPGWRPPRAS